MRQREIRFTKTLKEVSDHYAPKPAAQFIPEWYRNMETYFPQEKKPGNTASIKKCVPVLDSIMAGYILVTPCDVYVTKHEGEILFKSNLNNMVEFHDRKQAYLHPKANIHPIAKWINPWSIKTPKGFSTLFVQPFHRESVFTIFPGIVDTDNYSAPVNFPFVLNDLTFEGTIPAGTPMAQVIPIKRESWKMTFGNEEDYNKQEQTFFAIKARFFDGYRNMFWTKKEYK